MHRQKVDARRDELLVEQFVSPRTPEADPRIRDGDLEEARRREELDGVARVAPRGDASGREWPAPAAKRLFW